MQIITLNGKAEVKLNSSTEAYQANIVNGMGNVTIDRNLTAGQIHCPSFAMMVMILLCQAINQQHSQ